MQVYAAQSLVVRVGREEGRDGLEQWKGVLLGAFEALQSGSLVLCEAARRKFIQAIAHLALQSQCYVAWPQCLAEVFQRATAAAGNDPALLAILQLLCSLAEETARFNFTPEERYRWLHEMKGAKEALVGLFASIQPSQASIPLYGAKLECLAAWLRESFLPVDALFGAELDTCMAALHHQELFSPAIDLLTEVAGLPALLPEQSLALLRPLIAIAQGSWERSDTVRLIAAYSEAHCDDVFNALMLDGSQEAFAFLRLLLQLTGDEEREVGAACLPTWGLLHDLAIDHGLPAGPQITSLFTELARCSLRAARLPEDDDEAEDDDFLQYRRDLADTLLQCWRILRTDLLALLPSPSTQWKDLEVGLWALHAISEEVEEPHPSLTTLLSQLPQLSSVHPRCRIHVIRLFGALAHLRSNPPGTLEYLIGELQDRQVAVEAARALLITQQETPELIAPRMEPLLAALSQSQVPTAARTILARAVGGCISDTPAPLQALSTAIQAVMPPSLEDIKALETLTALLRAVNLKSAAAHENPTNSHTIQQAFAMVTNGMHMADDEERLSAICGLSEALCLALGPEAYTLAAPLTLTAASLPRVPAIELVCTALCIHGSTELIPAALTPILQLFQKVSVDEELAEAVLSLLSKVSGKGLAGLLLVQLDRPLAWSIQRLGASSLQTPLLRSILRLHISLLTHPDGDHAIDNLYSVYGPPLLATSLYAACNHMTRSQLESIGRLLFELYHRFPQPARLWMQQQVVEQEAFPHPSISREEKEKLAKALAAARSIGKAKQIIIEFCKT